MFQSLLSVNVAEELYEEEQVHPFDIAFIEYETQASFPVKDGGMFGKSQWLVVTTAEILSSNSVKTNLPVRYDSDKDHFEYVSSESDSDGRSKWSWLFWSR